MRCGVAGCAVAAGPGATHDLTMDAGIALTLNGEARRLAGAATVAELLATIGLDTRKVAVERNAAIVPKSAYAATALAEGDEIEIVHFIGGG